MDKDIGLVVEFGLDLCLFLFLLLLAVDVYASRVMMLCYDESLIDCNNERGKREGKRGVSVLSHIYIIL